MRDLVSRETIEDKIRLIRSHRIILDQDIAELYGVETKVLNQAVKRNIERFPEDFMFQLTQEEFQNLKSQFVTSSWGGRRTPPYAFTEQGVAMLSGVLRSERAISVNIAIMRAFVRLREMISAHAELKERLDQMEQRYDAQFQQVFQVIRGLLEDPPKPVRVKGFSDEKD